MLREEKTDRIKCGVFFFSNSSLNVSVVMLIINGDAEQCAKRSMRHGISQCVENVKPTIAILSESNELEAMEAAGGWRERKMFANI